jgi:hypothetical protein
MAEGSCHMGVTLCNLVDRNECFGQNFLPNFYTLNVWAAGSTKRCYLPIRLHGVRLWKTVMFICYHFARLFLFMNSVKAIPYT